MCKNLGAGLGFDGRWRAYPGPPAVQNDLWEVLEGRQRHGTTAHEPRPVANTILDLPFARLAADDEA